MPISYREARANLPTGADDGRRMPRFRPTRLWHKTPAAVRCVSASPRAIARLPNAEKDEDFWSSKQCGIRERKYSLPPLQKCARTKQNIVPRFLVDRPVGDVGARKKHRRP